MKCRPPRVPGGRPAVPERAKAGAGRGAGQDADSTEARRGLSLAARRAGRAGGRVDQVAGGRVDQAAGTGLTGPPRALPAPPGQRCHLAADTEPGPQGRAGPSRARAWKDGLGLLQAAPAGSDLHALWSRAQAPQGFGCGLLSALTGVKLASAAAESPQSVLR